MNRFMVRFPGFRQKALTLSFDDGVIQDKRFIEVIDRHGLKCTFNLNSERILKSTPKSIGLDEAKEVYKNHEIAIHSLKHPFLDLMPAGTASLEIARDRENLENIFGRIVKGMAYPMGGTQSDELVNAVRACGIKYARTTHPTYGFDMPMDWLRMNPTIHHTDERLMELSEKFVLAEPRWINMLFYVWGHTYEFDRENVGWNLLDDFCDTVSGHDDIWYATNMEIYDYMKAWEMLDSSIDTSHIYNPTTKTLYLEVDNTGEKFTLEPGEEKIFS